jgi:hypothetical protein
MSAVRHLTVIATPLQQLGCPDPDCDWRSQPFPETDRDHLPAPAVAAYVEHVENAHPRWRLLIRRARQQANTGQKGQHP